MTGRGPGKNPNKKYAAKIETDDGDTKYQYTDKRHRPERSGRRFYPLEKNPETTALMEKIKARIRRENNLPPDAKISDAEAMRVSMRDYAKG